MRASTVAQSADAVVAWPQPEAERRRVAGGERDGRDERERPRQPRAFGRCRGAPRALVDEQRVGLLGVDGGGEVCCLVAGAFAELAQAGHERAEAGAGLPVVGLEALDRRRERLGVQADRAQPLDVVDAGLDGDVVAAAGELEQRRDERVQAARDGVDVGEEPRHRRLLTRCGRRRPARRWARRSRDRAGGRRAGTRWICGGSAIAAP